MNTFIGRDWSKSVDDNWPRFKKIWPGLIKLAGIAACVWASELPDVILPR